MSRLPISVFIIAKDEEERIPKAIASVIGWVDEVVVVDSGSGDNTVKIAKDMGCRVVFNEWRGYGAQKVFGESLCKNKWILNIDADEYLTAELQDEIGEKFRNETIGDFYGYRIKIYNTFKNETKPKKFAYYFNQTRLYNREKAGFRNSTVHDAVIVEGVKEYSSGERSLIGQMKYGMTHDFLVSYSRWLEKVNLYSQMQAEDAYHKGKRTNWFMIILNTKLAFLKSYFARRYFLYGSRGFTFSCFYAISRFLKYAKLLEIQQNKEGSEK